MDAIYQNSKKKKAMSLLLKRVKHLLGIYKPFIYFSVNMSLLLKRVRHLLDIYKPFFYFSVNNPTDSRLKKKNYLKSKNIYQWRKHSHSMEANK